MCLAQTLVWLSSLLFSHHEIFKLVQYIPYSSPHEVFPFCKWNGMKFSSARWAFECFMTPFALLHGFTWAEWKAQFVAIRMFGLARAVPNPVVHRPMDCACQRMSYSWFFYVCALFNPTERREETSGEDDYHLICTLNIFSGNLQSTTSRSAHNSHLFVLIFFSFYSSFCFSQKCSRLL